MAADHSGLITFTGLPVPGATIIATQSDKRIIVHSDEYGVYRLSGLDDGVWNIRVEMVGFETTSADVTIAEPSTPSIWELKLLPFEETRKMATLSESGPASGGVPNAAAAQTESDLEGRAAPSNAAMPDMPDLSELERQAAEGFLVNGSVNNSAASPFAQSRAFGNNRSGQRSLYNGGIGISVGHSALDARPFSFAGERVPKPDYTDLQLMGTFGGPLRIPRVLRNGPVFFIGYQRSADHIINTHSALVPTERERAGDFFQTPDAQGNQVQIVDPETGLPFPGRRIPSSRISRQASALLNYYPAPNVTADGRYNYQASLLSISHQDNLQSRFTQTINNRNNVFGVANYQRTTADAANLFGFVDKSSSSNLDATINWSHRFSQFFSVRVGYQFTRQTMELTPYFANRMNVSGDAGITGNNQEPINWGPPSLIFSSGLAGLSDGQPADSDSQAHALSAESTWRPRGRHNFTFGGAVRRQSVDVMAQQNPRGSFGFTGAAAGSDLADFLLGIPETSSIAFGNADKYLRAPAFNAYVTDDWRLNPEVTINAGIRWEYEAPFTERLGRLANLEVEPDFTTIRSIVATRSNPLLHADTSGFQPRLAIALRPLAGSSLVIRAGYGVYRNTSVYQSIALLMAQQPPLSKTFSIANSAANPLTLANGFVISPNVRSNTFAVDPDFRVSDAHNWQFSLQRDLPVSLTVTAAYLGTKGSRLMQEFVPNTYPSGAANPCPSCPSGFVYLTSNGSSERHAAQVQVRRRLRNGLAAVAQYTLSKATDDAAAFTTADLSGGSIAQNWLDLEAERARSSFDQRHVVTAQFEYSPTVRTARGALEGFTFTGQLTAGSGLPLTPIYLTPLAGTGITGTVRADYTGAAIDQAPPGFYVNPAAFSAPAPGRWGSARRNSITGPAQFSLNMGVARTFLLTNRLTMEWRLDATNVLNRVTYASVNTIVGSPQFGLPNRANPMRKMQSGVRMRF
jgi:hypothetical protein